tara:strand:- start:27 stop:3587 length:3561 start_codon:yes stop_codon:yes gene_type:complete
MPRRKTKAQQRREKAKQKKINQRNRKLLIQQNENIIDADEDIITQETEPPPSSLSKRQKKRIRQKKRKLINYMGDFDINLVNTLQNEKFKAQQSNYNINFRSGSGDPVKVARAMTFILKRTIDELLLNNNDRYRFILTGSDNRIVSTPYMNIGDGDYTEYLEKFATVEMIVDSYGVDWIEVFSKIMKIQLVVIKSPLGVLGSFVKGDQLTKRSVITIKNTDDLCLGRCLVVAIAIRDNHPKLKQIKMGRPNKKNNDIQTTLTHELYEKSGITKEIADLEKIMEFEKYLNCNISVIDSNNFNTIIYPDMNSEDYEDKEFKIYLYKTENHIDLINCNKVAGFFDKNYFCKKCNKTYSSKDKHKCRSKCNICCSYDCDCVNLDFKLNPPKKWSNCNDCFRFFPSSKCFENHKETTCDKIWKCKDCKKILNKKEHPIKEHICGDFVCRNCGVKVGKDHKCYMFPKPIKTPSEKYIFFDFEATQNKGFHEVNLAVSQYFDSPEPIIHYNNDDFCEWLFSKKHKGYTIIAHNGKGYDYQFIMKWIYNKTSYKPFVIYAGSKIMTFSINENLNIRFVDSVNFLAMPLECFPKTFGIKELKKGFYPHLFNTDENFNYIGEIPDEDDFCCDNFKINKRNEFKIWWEDKVNSDYIWNNKKELIEYCISDVDILRKTMIKFRQLYLDIADIDPLQYSTIASVCMAIYRGHYIIENYNSNYLKFKELDNLEEFQEETRKKVFEDKKIALITYEDQQFIREAFFGGRTNSTAIKYDFEEGEIGCYADITSLYPTTNFYDEYGTGHLTRITEITREIQHKLLNREYIGYVKVDITPPNDLYFPVLPEKGEKLTFDLKRKIGVWTTPEIYEALNQGYKINKIYEIRHYNQSSRNLFKPYVSKFLKLKQESSGKPDWVKNDDDLNKYILDYKNKQGILLNKNNIKQNKGLRAVAKLCLNSLWGKFGMRLNLPKTEITNNINTFNNLVFSEKYEPSNIFFIDEERVEIKYKEKIDTIQLDTNTNIGVACFTTSNARLRLYEGMKVLGKQVLYNDTDSLVYRYDKNNKNHKKLPLGDLLGEWTDELEGKHMINTFVGGGPKNYSYETNDNIQHTKIKGFNLNYSAKQKIHHNSMLEVILNRSRKKDENYIEVDYFSIVRNKDKSLKSITQPKKYSFEYNKRHILKPDKKGNIFTLPFGHKDIIK